MKSNLKEKGPVITISREYGAQAIVVAELLAKKLTEITNNKWDYVTHQILTQTAKQFNVDEHAVSHIFEASERNIFSQFFDSLIDKYPTDKQIKDTLGQMVRKYAEAGNFIIVGRAGCIIARDIPKSLHVRITAPFKLKIKNIMHSMCLNEEDALKNFYKVNEQRENFLKFYSEDKSHTEIFDAIYSRASLNTEQIVEQIANLAKVKNLF